MREKTKVKIVLSLLIAVFFMLPASSVIGSNVSTETVKAGTLNQIGTQVQEPQIGYINPVTGIQNDAKPLAGAPYDVWIDSVSVGGVDYWAPGNDGYTVKTGTYPLDVTVCADVGHQDCGNGSAYVKKFIEVYQKKTIPGTPDTTVSLYCENFETPCEVYQNWSTQDMPVPGYNGALDTWTWSAKRYESPSHSMHSTSFDQYLPNQWDILELGFGGAGLDVSAYDVVNITWWQWIQGDAHDSGNGTIIISDYGYFEVQQDAGAWTPVGLKYYTSNGAWQKVGFDIPVTDTTMKFRWVWKSDSVFCYEGWYIDDVCLNGIIKGTQDTISWVFVMDSHSYPQWITPDNPCETYIFPEQWTVTQEGDYKVCAWVEVINTECFYSWNDFDAPMCILITIGNIFDLGIDCDYTTITPPTPAWQGDDVTSSVLVYNDGTLDATNVQVQMMAQYGTFNTIGFDSCEGWNAPNGLIPMRALPPDHSLDGRWVRGTSSNLNTTMAGNLRGYEHSTTYDKTQGTGALCNFQELAFPYRYRNYQSPNDYCRGPLLWTPADATAGIQATVDFTISINGPGDKVQLGVWDWVGGWTSSYSWTGPAYQGWTKITIPVSTMINNLKAHWVAGSQFGLFVYHTKISTFPAPIVNNNPANPNDAYWSGWMLDNIRYETKIITNPTPVFTQTAVIPSLPFGYYTFADFEWDNVPVGRYLLTYSVLNSDSDASNNFCYYPYDVFNMLVKPTDLQCVDYTGQGPTHWNEEGCCGGYLWCGDPQTTMYGNNWSDCLYLKNATGSITFDLSAHGAVNLLYDTWFQINANDKGLVQYSLDKGTTWTTVATWTGNSAAVPGSNVNGWFSDIHGVPTSTKMQFRFLFQSNASFVNRGWLLDNITLTDNVNPADIIFGPDPCKNLNHFYAHAQQFGCWWRTPDQFGVTDGYGCYDPNYVADSWYAKGMYPDNLDCAAIWTLTIPEAWYGILVGRNFADLGVNDFAYMDVSADNGATWTNLLTMLGSPQPGKTFGHVYNYTGPWNLALNKDTLLIRWRLTSDASNAIPYVGPGFENIAFYGMSDVTPPVTTLTMTGTFDETYHYYTSAVKMKLTATDDITGVAKIYYKLDGVTHEYTGIVTINTDGTHTFCYWSVDVQGNVEPEHCVLPFRIDLTGPTVTITGPATGALYLFGSHILDLKSGKTIFLFGGIPVTATATASDAPILVVRFFLDDVLLAEDSTAPYSATLSVKHSGAAVIVVKAVDVLGHEAVSAPLNIDNYVKII